MGQAKTVPRSIELALRDGESIESALLRFKRKVLQEGVIKEIKRHAVYLKPVEKDRVKAALARERSRRPSARMPGLFDVVVRPNARMPSPKLSSPTYDRKQILQQNVSNNWSKRNTQGDLLRQGRPRSAA
jgi:small subunit ribosomal protein S21